jgi:uncharacterized protein YjbJ (UPF0337 family)
MDKDKVKGAIDDAAGRVKRQVGEWTGDTSAQAEGAAQQVKGKVERRGVTSRILRAKQNTIRTGTVML